MTPVLAFGISGDYYLKTRIQVNFLLTWLEYLGRSTCSRISLINA